MRVCILEPCQDQHENPGQILCDKPETHHTPKVGQRQARICKSKDTPPGRGVIEGPLKNGLQPEPVVLSTKPRRHAISPFDTASMGRWGLTKISRRPTNY